MNKVTGLRRSYDSSKTAAELDFATSINSTYKVYADPDYLNSGMKNVFISSKISAGDMISRRTNAKYLEKLAQIREDNYQSKWYESGWFRSFRASGKKLKFAKTYYPIDENPYSTENSQAFCLDRILTANFENTAGFPYGEVDGHGYPEGIYSGQKFKICGFERLDLPAAPFISPYRNIFELRDHSGYQLGSMGKNYWTKEELLNFGLSEQYATIQSSGIKLLNQTGLNISYNKIYFQDNIPNLEWCFTNRCSFIYTEMIGRRAGGLDEPYSYRKESSQPTMSRIFVFSGATSWIPTGDIPLNYPLGFGPYFQPGNTGLFKLYNNFSLKQSGTLNDKEVYDFVVINSGDLPKNFYISSKNQAIQIINDSYKTSDFYYPDDHPLSGKLVEYYTVGKKNSIKINYLNNYIKTGTLNRTLANGTQIYLNSGAIILHEVTGTLLANGKLSFLTKDTQIPAVNEVLANNSRIFFDDYFFVDQKQAQIAPLGPTGQILYFDTSGNLLKQQQDGTFSPLNRSIFGLTAYITGININQRLPFLKNRFLSGFKAIPDYQSQANIIFSSPQENYVDIVNTNKQYLKYSQGFSGLFASNGQVVYTKGGFDPITGAVELDILFRLRKNDLPTFDLSNSRQEFVTVTQSSNSFTFKDTVLNSTRPLSGLILKKGFTYNLLQINNTTGHPIAVKGDISGLNVFEPNGNKGNTPYRMLQFTVTDRAENIEYFSINQTPIQGSFSLTGNNIFPSGQGNQVGAILIRSSIANANQLPIDDRITRSGAKVIYRFNNENYPEINLETDKTYNLLVFTGYTGFYFYTGSDIFGSGRNPYTGTAIKSDPVSGGLFHPTTLQLTGFQGGPTIRYSISAAHIPDNLYYGDKFSAYAGNKITKVTPKDLLPKNRFSPYRAALITGLINIETSDILKESVRIDYALLQYTGQVPIV